VEISPEVAINAKRRIEAEFRLRQFKMLLDAVEDYVGQKYPATGEHS
jgi:hypothetical protein